MLASCREDPKDTAKGIEEEEAERSSASEQARMMLHIQTKKRHTNTQKMKGDSHLAAGLAG